MPIYGFEMVSSFLVSNCSNMTDSEELEVKENFAKILNEKNVCKHGKTQLCHIGDMTIVCGYTYDGTRRKRNIDSIEEEEVEITVTIKGLQDVHKSADCPRFCPRFRLSGEYCERYCVRVYKKYVKAGLVYAQRNIEVLNHNASAMLAFTAAGRHFEPREAGEVTDLQIDCPIGTIAESDMCGECAFLDSSNFESHKKFGVMTELFGHLKDLMMPFEIFPNLTLLPCLISKQG